MVDAGLNHLQSHPVLISLNAVVMLIVVKLKLLAICYCYLLLRFGLMLTVGIALYKKIKITTFQ